MRTSSSFEFSGDDRLIADYLSEEVLQAQPDDRRELLLHISVLDSMCAELIAHLTDEAEPPARPRRVGAGFDVPRSRWTHDASGFASIISSETCCVSSCEPSRPGAEARLLNQAAAWHLERGDVSPALEYLLRARELG